MRGSVVVDASIEEPVSVVEAVAAPDCGVTGVFGPSGSIDTWATGTSSRSIDGFWIAGSSPYRYSGARTRGRFGVTYVSIRGVSPVATVAGGIKLVVAGEVSALGPEVVTGCFEVITGSPCSANDPPRRVEVVPPFLTSAAIVFAVG
jgi:hypothetical protein